jgi:hypothetical protein
MAKKKKPAAKVCCVTRQPIADNEPAPGYCDPTKPLRCDQPAFPHGDKAMSRGMTLRDYFAAKALIGILGARQGFLVDVGTDNAPGWAYRIADKMLEARK